VPVHLAPMWLIIRAGWLAGMDDEVVQLWGVSRVYGSAERAVRALDRVTVAFARGTFTAVMGPSGSGESTLLQCAAGLDRPTDGKIVLGQTDLGWDITAGNDLRFPQVAGPRTPRLKLLQRLRAAAAKDVHCGCCSTHRGHVRLVHRRGQIAAGGRIMGGGEQRIEWMTT
jgi:energy-coupling factor transporter ATP-binding protein EcfA2